MKILTVIGARPQFVKAAPVSKAITEAGHCEVLVHTGQHYDYLMSQVFFDEMSIPQPDANLEVGSDTHGHQTGEMLIRVENIMLEQKPDWVLVYGDTNSTLAGALAAVKLDIPIAHVESGLRSFNKKMPEEHNRILTDHCASVLFSPTQTAVDNLRSEGLTRNVFLVGDTMYDAILMYSQLKLESRPLYSNLHLSPKSYYLATVHRPYNTDSADQLDLILTQLSRLDKPVIFPIHPRTRHKLRTFGLEHFLDQSNQLRLIEPVGYLDMLALEKNADLILTDSGGVQKEAYLLNVPCVTIRTETEWVETVETGWNRLIGENLGNLPQFIRSTVRPEQHPALYGDGMAAQRVVNYLEKLHGNVW